MENLTVSEIASKVLAFAEEKYPEIGWKIWAINDRALHFEVASSPYPANEKSLCVEGPLCDAVNDVYDYMDQFNDYDESRGPSMFGFRFAIDFHCYIDF